MDRKSGGDGHHLSNRVNEGSDLQNLNHRFAAYIQAGGDGQLVSNRVNEKSDLQNLNQRFSAYIQAVRSAQEQQIRQQSWMGKSSQESSASVEIRKQYEQQIAEDQARLEELTKEKQDLELNRVRYETTTNEYESRIVSLNELVFEKQNELQRLHGALAAKDVELQEARSDAMQPRLALEAVRMEVEDLRKRLEEAERRLLLETNAKSEVQLQYESLQNKMRQEILIYQQELTELRTKLEASHQLTIQLEEKVRKTGQSDSSIAEMMRKVREASEMELRRFMEETEAKHNLNIQEVKMRMEADVHNLAALVEENASLQAQIQTQATEISSLQSKLTMIETQKQASYNALENEKALFQSNVRNLERKLQETQDLLLVKIRELGVAQEANVPLRAEINALKALIEEEEKRLKLSITSSGSAFVSNLATRHQLTTSNAFVERLGGDARRSQDYSNFAQGLTTSQGKTIGGSGTAAYYPMPGGKTTMQSNSVAIGTQGFKDSEYQSPAKPTLLPTQNLKQTASGFENPNKYLTPSTESISSQMFETNDGEEPTKMTKPPIGIDELPPQSKDSIPPVPLPPRPASASNSRYVSAASGQGKDYFNAMFNDLRKDTMYSRVTEDAVAPSTARVSSVHQDLINSTGSMGIGKSRTWFSGTYASATGNLKVLQVADDGSYVSISNTSATEEENIGGFMLQQNVGGHPVSVFRFPPRAMLQPSNSTTVWSGKAVNGVHNPPFHFVWSKLDKWGTGPECTTILCKPNGQAVAWSTSAPQNIKLRKSRKTDPEVKRQTEETQKLLEDMRVKKQQEEQEYAGSEGDDDWKPDPVTLPSVYTTKPTLYKDTDYSPKPVRTIRCPRLPNGELQTSMSAGLLPSRTGSVPLHLHQPRPPMQVSQSCGAEAPYHPPWSLYYQEEDENVASGIESASPASHIYQNGQRQHVQSAPAGMRGTYSQVPRKSPGQSARVHIPGTFWPPAEQHRQGMKWIRSQHNIDFMPPMPKAFPCVTPIYKTTNEFY